MVEGAQPFFAANYHALLQQILNEAPIEPRFTRVHPGLWKIVRRGLLKAPEERWQSARALGCALARWADQHGVREDMTGQPLYPMWSTDLAEAEPSNWARLVRAARGRRDWAAGTLAAARGRRVWAAGAPAATTTTGIGLASLGFWGSPAEASSHDSEIAKDPFE